jgi:hypothetical protein
MLCALAIVGVIAGASVMAFGGRSDALGVRAEAQRLADRLNLAADEAMLSSEVIALDLDGEGYRFVVGADDGRSWAPHASPLLGPRRDAPAGLAFASSESDLLPIAPGRGGGAAFVVSGSAAAWQVSFDGLAARAAPVEQD